MIGLSTSWASSRVKTGGELVQTLTKFAVEGVELDYRINQSIFAEMRPPLKKSHLKVVSVHNFFPFPRLHPHLRPSGDLFLLSHTDKERRREAVKWTITGMEIADDLEARRMVLHCGYVDMDPEFDLLSAFFKRDQIEADTAQAFLARKQAAFAKKKGKHLDSLLFSLEDLLRAAEKYDLRLGLENRFHFHELPGPEDFEMIFDTFKGAPLGYWHDTGHAHVNECLTFTPRGYLLNKYGEQLIGIHVHDAMGLEDHLVPGTGKIDFEALKDYITPDLPLVLELKPSFGNTEITDGIRFLRERVLDVAAQSIE